MSIDERITRSGVLAFSVLCMVGAGFVAAQPAPVLVWYMGNMAPDAVDSGGPGVSFTLSDGTPQGELVYDAAAGDYRAWYIKDSTTAKTKWRTNMPTEIACGTGATIVGRVRVPFQKGAKGTNLVVYDDIDGATSGYFWAGAGAIPGTPGLIRESYRAVETTLTPDAGYHILRMTVIGGSPGCVGVDRVINFYFDESTTPVLTINPAADRTEGANTPESFGFGASNVAGQQDIYFDWVTATNRGAFVPGAEVAVLGRSLVPTNTLPPCELGVLPEPLQPATAVQGQSATPAQIPYTVFNSGQNAISFTVAKVPDDATTAWLTLNHTSAGPLSTGATDTIVANLNASGLSVGTYAVDLRFTSDCSPPTVVTRTVQLTVTGSLQITPSPGLTVPAESATPSTRTFTITNAGTSDLNYTVAKLEVCDWLTLDKTSGGPVSPGATDTVSVTVNPAGIVADQTCNLRFTNTNNPAETADRAVTVDVLDSVLLLSYLGDVAPGTANSFQPDHTFLLATSDDTDVDQGSLVENDPGALDGKAWRIVDDDLHKTRWYSQPQSQIDPSRGATIVGRVAVESIAGTPRPGNLLIRENAGLSAEYHFAGPHANATRAGRVSEAIRQIDSTPDPLKANSNYHILRMTVIGGPGTGLERTIRLYIDESPTPVVEILNASEDSYVRDQFGFGANHVNAVQTIKFDYIRATTAGAFAPGEECAAIGECLVLPEAGACCMADQSCSVLWPNACVEADGQYMGVGTTCEQVSCPFRCHTPFADTDGDGDVDSADFATWQWCLSTAGPVPAEPAYCQCLDRDNGGVGDGDIDEDDLQKFMQCGSGAAVPADPDCEP